MNKKVILWVVLAAAVLLGIYLASSSQTPSDQMGTPAPAPSNTQGTAAPKPAAGSSVGNPTVKPTGGTIQVDIKGFAFVSETVRVAPGTKVVWKNMDDAKHQVVGNGFQSKVLNKGDTFSFTFDKEGTFAYFCGIHPNMKGEVVVRK